jgi:hypothetical protein
MKKELGFAQLHVCGHWRCKIHLLIVIKYFMVRFTLLVIQVTAKRFLGYKVNSYFWIFSIG